MTQIGIIHASPEQVIQAPELQRGNGNGLANGSTTPQIFERIDIFKNESSEQDVWISYGPFFPILAPHLVGEMQRAFPTYKEHYWIDRNTMEVEFFNENGLANIGSGCQLIGSDVVQKDNIPFATATNSSATDRYGAFRIPIQFTRRDLEKFFSKIIEKRHFYALMPTLINDFGSNGQLFQRTTRFVTLTKKGAKLTGKASCFLVLRGGAQFGAFGRETLVSASLVIKHLRHNVPWEKVIAGGVQPMTFWGALETHANMSEETIALLALWFPWMSNSILFRDKPRKRGKSFFQVNVFSNASNHLSVVYSYTVVQFGENRTQDIFSQPLPEEPEPVNKQKCTTFKVTQRFEAYFVPTDVVNSIIGNIRQEVRPNQGIIPTNTFEEVVQSFVTSATFTSGSMVRANYQFMSMGFSYVSRTSLPFGNMATLRLLKNSTFVIDASCDIAKNRFRLTNKGRFEEVVYPTGDQIENDEFTDQGSDNISSMDTEEATGQYVDASQTVSSPGINSEFSGFSTPQGTVPALFQQAIKFSGSPIEQGNSINNGQTFN